MRYIFFVAQPLLRLQVAPLFCIPKALDVLNRSFDGGLAAL
jgi:hypothetical protein